MNEGQELDLTQRLVMITGGSSGVGLACAQQLLSANANVVIVGSSQRKIDTALAQLNATNARGFVGDVRSSKTADDAFAFAENQFGTKTSVLINCAGTILRESAERTSDEDWATVMEVNVNGVFYFSRAFAQQAETPGAIVNVSSTCGQVGAAGLAAYCASKGAVDQLTRAMALELADRHITVNAVAPGAINSPMLYSKHADGVVAEQIKNNNLASIPIGALAEPQDVCRAILFLARQQHITGTILSVDGGYTAH